MYPFSLLVCIYHLGNMVSFSQLSSLNLFYDFKLLVGILDVFRMNLPGLPTPNPLTLLLGGKNADSIFSPVLKV